MGYLGYQLSTQIIVKTENQQRITIASNLLLSTPLIVLKKIFNCNYYSKDVLQCQCQNNDGPSVDAQHSPWNMGVKSDSGWMIEQLFFGWFKQFLKFNEAIIGSLILLLLDDHSTHTIMNEAWSHAAITLFFRRILLNVFRPLILFS